MRRAAVLFIVTALLLSGCGEKQKDPANSGQSSDSSVSSSTGTMTIEQTRFDQETEEVLKLLDIKGGFYEFTVDETVTGFSMNVWVLNDGLWVNSGEIVGKIENGKGRVGVQLLDDGCGFFQLGEKGYTKYSVKYDPNMRGCAAVGKLSLDPASQDTVIVPGKEQYLFVELGWEDASKEQMTADFRDSDCDAGVAATITFIAASNAEQ